MNDTSFYTEHIDIIRCKIVLGQDSIICSHDELFFRFVGFRASNSSLKNLIHDDDIDAYNNFINELQSNGSSSSILRVKRTDDVFRTFLLVGSDINLSVDKVNHYNVDLIDIINSFDYMENLSTIDIKYTQLLELDDRDYFDYNFKTGYFRIYKIQNSSDVEQLNISLNDLKVNFDESSDVCKEDLDNFTNLCYSLENGELFFKHIFKDYSIFSDVFEKKEIFLKGTTIISNFEKFIATGIIMKNESNIMYDFSTNLYKLDPMTSLLNKNSALEYARTCIEENTYEQLHLIMLDLDNFKYINDSYGHMFGDEVIKRTATILKSVVGNRGIAARFGGDEFFLVMHDLGIEGDLRSVLHTIYSQLRWAFAEKLDDFILNCSVGISEYPANGNNFDILFRKADKGLYIAKKKGKARYIIYSEEKHGDISIDDPKHLSRIIDNCNDTSDKSLNDIKDIIQQLFASDESHLNAAIQDVIKLFSLDGISVFTGDDMHKIACWGDYKIPMPDAKYMFSSNVIRRFNYKDAFFENDILTSGFYIPELHDVLMKYGIASTVHCIIGSKKNVKGLVTYDLTSTIKRWSNDEVDSLIILTQVIGHILNINVNI